MANRNLIPEVVAGDNLDVYACIPLALRSAPFLADLKKADKDSARTCHSRDHCRSQSSCAFLYIKRYVT